MFFRSPEEIEKEMRSYNSAQAYFRHLQLAIKHLGKGFKQLNDEEYKQALYSVGHCIYEFGVAGIELLQSPETLLVFASFILKHTLAEIEQGLYAFAKDISDFLTFSKNEQDVNDEVELPTRSPAV